MQIIIKEEHFQSSLDKWAILRNLILAVRSLFKLVINQNYHHLKILLLKMIDFKELIALFRTKIN
jgi:hypothetical protein